MASKEKRFVVTYSQGGGFAGPGVQILVDKATGVNYIYTNGGYGGGLTPLLNANGTPVVTPVPKEAEK